MNKIKDLFLKHSNYTMPAAVIFCFLLMATCLSIMTSTGRSVPKQKMANVDHNESQLSAGQNVKEFSAPVTMVKTYSDVMQPAAGVAARSNVPQAVTVGSFVVDPHRLVTRHGSLEITVKSPDITADEIQEIAESFGGYVIHDARVPTENGNSIAEIQIRVPSARFQEALQRVRKLAVKVDNEQVSAEDVTRQVVDLEAHVHNMRAEEEQYNEILKGAHKVSEIMEVQSSVNEVRDRIERTQAELDMLKHDSAMSTLNVQVRPPAITRVVAVVARDPWKNVRQTAQEVFFSLENYADTMVAFLLWLPMLMIWFATLSLGSLTVYRIGRWGWKIAVASGLVTFPAEASPVAKVG